MTAITYREPYIVNVQPDKGWKLSPRRLGTLLNVLPPEAISLEAAAEMLHEADFYVRYNAAKILGKRGDREARLILQAALMDGSAPTRASAARHLYGLSWYAAEPLLRQALRDEDARVREAAIYALGEIGTLAAYGIMAAALQTEEDYVRAAAAWGLRDCQDSDAVPVLVTALGAEDEDVRSKVLETLGANGTPAAAQAISHSLWTDSSPYVQYAAAQSLLEVQEHRALPELAEAIAHFTGAKREAIIRGFFHATNYLGIKVGQSAVLADILTALEQATLDNHAPTRIQAIFPLAWLPDERASDLILAAYDRETDLPTKAQILRVACSLMSPASEFLLADGLEAEDDTVRQMAATMQAILNHPVYA